MLKEIAVLECEKCENCSHIHRFFSMNSVLSCTCTLSGYNDIFTYVDTEVIRYIICVNFIHTDI